MTVCGNCLEICRKLDSIRAAGFPDSSTNAGESSLEGFSEDQPRPSSELPPDTIPEATGEDGPGTAAACIETSTVGIDDKDGRRDRDDGLDYNPAVQENIGHDWSTFAKSSCHLVDRQTGSEEDTQPQCEEDVTKNGKRKERVRFRRNTSKKQRVFGWTVIPVEEMKVFEGVEEGNRYVPIAQVR